MPHLAALICAASFDIAIHDAFGKANGCSSYATYSKRFMAHDLAWFFGDEKFAGKYPSDFFVQEVPDSLPVWHLVGGKDLLRESDRIGGEPDDGYPVSLEKWIERDGLTSLKIKLTGDDAEWDYHRMVEVGALALPMGVKALSPDFNCRVKATEYVTAILDKLAAEHPDIFDALLYVEQPFAYDIEANRINVGDVVQRKDIFMDESAHDWRFVEIGRTLGWNGVALKTCKTQTGALLSGCWAKMHGMKLMVQDLTNPRYAIRPHVLLAAHFGTIRGVECNAAQFCPEASADFERSLPGLYERRGGVVRVGELKKANGLGV
jgi:L-alanine-DL-glutamate epimerase-like enolase superfamily enzyme